MRFISHRGNLSGPDRCYENDPGYIDHAISIGYDVEIDVRIYNSEIYLGHDYPHHKIDNDWLLSRKDKLWIHCKDTVSLSLFNKSYSDLIYFTHDSDIATLTSNGVIWAYPSINIIDNSIHVLPELNFDESNANALLTCFGICSDYITKYEVILNESFR
jgi:hypothetical protein